MNQKHTCLVLGKTGVGKSSLINGISEGTVQMEAKKSKSPVTLEMKEATFTKDGETYNFIVTPGLDDPNYDEKNKSEIKKAASEYPDFKYILLLFNFQADRLDKSSIQMLESYMKIFPVQYFWEHVLIVYTKTASIDGDDISEQIEDKKGDFVKTVNEDRAYESFRNFMKNNKINPPDEIPEFFVNSVKNISKIDYNTKKQYNEILKAIRCGKKMFQKIDFKDRLNLVTTGSKLNKIQTMRTILYVPRYGKNISLEEFNLPPERDDIAKDPIDSTFEEENTYEVVSKNCKKYYRYKIYKINYYDIDGEKYEEIEIIMMIN